MSRKIFVSYKYSDSQVKPLHGYYNYTVRDYVDYIQDNNFSGDDINKGEKDDEDLSQFKDDTIRDHLKLKIWDSSVTLVFISPNMIDYSKNESDQWIPWEIAYSLRNQSRNGIISHSNAIVAVVIPDLYTDYDYFINNWKYDNNTKTVNKILTYKTFKIIASNMFNEKNPDIKIINGKKVYFGDCSYIMTVKWEDFINHTDFYLDKAIEIRDNIDSYNISAIVSGD